MISFLRRLVHCRARGGKPPQPHIPQHAVIAIVLNNLASFVSWYIPRPTVATFEYLSRQTMPCLPLSWLNQLPSSAETSSGPFVDRLARQAMPCSCIVVRMPSLPSSVVVQSMGLACISHEQVDLQHLLHLAQTTECSSSSCCHARPKPGGCESSVCCHWWPTQGHGNFEM